MKQGKRPYKPSEAFERFWRGWFPARHRPRPKPARTYEGCEVGRGWHLWVYRLGPATVCSACMMTAMDVAARREAARVKLAAKPAPAGLASAATV